MPKARAFSYLAIVCVLLFAATPFWAQEEKAPAPEANVNIVTQAKKKGLKIVKMVKPVYPPEAKAEGIEGLVKVDVVVNDEGDVTEAEAMSGPEILRTAAVEAVRRWKYQPLGVEVHATVNVNFTLASKAPEGNINVVTEARKKGLKIVKMVKPVYPPEAKAKGIEGLVKIKVVVDKEGAVKEAEAMSGPEALKTAALEAVRQWKYEPLGVEVRATIDVNFKLGAKPQPAEPKAKS